MDADELAAEVRTILARTAGVTEMRMFGGIGFMLNGNLLAGASRRGLLLRVGKDRQAELLAANPGSRPMVMRGRTMEGYLYLDGPALNADTIKAALRTARDFVRGLPAKPAAKQRPARKSAVRKRG